MLKRIGFWGVTISLIYVLIGMLLIEPVTFWEGAWVLMWYFLMLPVSLISLTLILVGKLLEWYNPKVVINNS